jgi:hypothetical protein
MLMQHGLEDINAVPSNCLQIRILHQSSSSLFVGRAFEITNPSPLSPNMTTHASKTCCERPRAATAQGYEPKGTYEAHGGLTCYVTGPKDARKAIFFVYDVFGFQEETLQGADILSSTEYLVAMPDLFAGKPIQKEWFAQDTEEKKQKIADIMASIRDPHPHIEKVQSVLASLRQTFSAVEKWGAIGCTYSYLVLYVH